jgi:tRNA A-37 threonylcarbamoyl transferase component Bud32
LPRPLAKEGSLSFFRWRDDDERPQPTAGLAVGKVLGDYRLVSLLGQGGMGQVWEAEQVSLRRRVALKFVRPECVTERQLELFAREARAGGRLHHPGIVTVFGHGQSDGLAWIAMEFVGGAWTLRHFLDEVEHAKELPDGYDRHVAGVVAEIADAMQAAHDAAVIHRDLKPQNVLITSEDKPKVTDFGLARITDETALSVTGDFAGTYFYMSPEQVMARRMGIDHRSDVFSLGVVLYELLALRRPFEGDTSHQVAAQIVTKDPPDIRTIRSRVPRDLAVIAAKALEKDRDKRFQTMKELAADLRRYLANESIHARPATRLDRTIKWAKRNPTKSTAAAIVLLAVSAITVLLIENVRANRRLEVERTNLADANAGLAAKTTEAERLREEAVTREAAATARADALRAIEELRNLETIEGDLEYARSQERPTHVWWLEQAHELVEGRQADPARNLPRTPGLDDYRDLRERMRREALPPTAAELAADRAGHPKAGELATKRAELLWTSRMLGLEPWPGASEGEAELTAETSTASELNSRAWALVDPDARNAGREVEAVGLARSAVDSARSEERAAYRDTYAWALFWAGRIDEALAEEHLAIEAVEHEERRDFENALHRMKSLRDNAVTARHEVLVAEVAALEREVNEPRTFHFDDREMAWWNTHLTGLVQDLEDLRGRLAVAERCVSTPEAQAQWRQAIEAIGRSEKYGGLRLTPQLELLPLGPDPDSGLWEFTHLATGDPAVRGSDGELLLKPETGIVFVLIPSGRVPVEDGMEPTR